MGHVIQFITVDKRKDIMPAAEEFAFYNTDREENPSGNYHGNLTIHDHEVYMDREAAENAIDLMDKGFYDDHAVKYYVYPKSKDSKRLSDLKLRKETLVGRRKEYEKAHSVRNRSAKLITCPTCESKINKEYLKTEFCPVCRKDLRAEGIRIKLKDYDKKINELEKKIKEEERKQNLKMKLKAKEKWLVKVEVHC